MRIALLASLVLITMPAAAQAQSPKLLEHARSIAKACPGNWEAQGCLSTVSASNMDLAVDYMTKLDAAGKKDAVEEAKQLCAASTAATKGEYPAYAMQSAFTECANGIYDISEKTGVKPDQSHYQLLVGAVLCLSKAKECSVMEQQMQAYAR